MIKIIDTMLKRTLLLSCKVVFDSANRLGVSVEKHEPSVTPDEYGRLWAACHMKVLEGLGYPTNIDALLALAMIEKILSKPFGGKTDCFERAGLSEIVEYTESSPIGHDITARYYAQKQRRLVIVEMRRDIPSKHLIYGSIGLLQFALNRCEGREEELTLLFKMAKTILYLLSSDSAYETDNLTQLHDTAYALVKQSHGHNWSNGTTRSLTDRKDQ